MELNKKNLSKMTASQQAAYRKKLAYVRKYVKDRSEWRRLQRAGTTTFPTLQMYRDNKYGKLPARSSEKTIQELQVPMEDLEGKLERLLARIRENKKETEKELRSLLG